jgi:hypothetical protein
MIDYQPNKIVNVSGTNNIEFIDNFFIYLYNNPNKVKFKYDRAPSLTFSIAILEDELTIMSKPLICLNRKLRISFIDTLDYSKKETLDQLFDVVVDELNKISTNKIFYFQRLMPTISIIDDPAFISRRGIMIRYAETEFSEKVVPNSTGGLFCSNLKPTLNIVPPIIDPIEVLMKKIGYDICKNSKK